jgi:tRNA A-37 threonylcarbamoyl transferase component Bud32
LGRLGGYRVLQVLGAGGMGVVFLAEDVQLKRQVALKVMKPEAARKPAARERFLREAQAAAALEHEHIVTIHHVGAEGGVPFLAMQWLKGMSLEERLKRPSPLNLAQVLRLGRQIARGLAAAHERGLVHRDIKPANLWLEPEHGGRVKILDFGLARAVADEAHLTQSGVVVGTAAYMAPEQAAGGRVDHRCDLFSLGVVLYRMATGRLPFRGDNTLALLNSLATDTPMAPHQLNPAVPLSLSELILQLLAKVPAGRPQSAKEVADRLQALERQLTAPAVAVTPAPIKAYPMAIPVAAARPPARRRILVAAAVAMLTVVPLSYFCGGTVIRLVTNKGDLVIETDDPNLEVTVKGPSATIYDKVKDRRFVLTAGDYDVEVREEGDGGVRFATKRFSITRGGKETLNARLELANAERVAAEWVLSVGGKVTVRAGDKEMKVTAAGDLPAGAFQVVAILLSGPEVTDEALAHIRTLTHLTQLFLSGTRVSNDGLEHLKLITDLTHLGLISARVNDAGLVHLKALPNLHRLWLPNTQISDDGLAHLESLTNLQLLELGHTQVSDDGLKHLYGLIRLEEVVLTGTKVTAEGKAALQKALPKCKIIDGPAPK